jgi:hypothetical protein
MTKQERKIKSMLNYYEIDMGGSKDEKMTKAEKKKFIDTLNNYYDAHTVNDILDKIRNKTKSSDEEEPTDEFFDPMQDEPFNDDEEESKQFPKDLNSHFKNIPPFGGMNQLPLNPEIERFISWISDLLYSADHKVVIKESPDGKTTNIELHKIKKRGGRKK